MSAPNWLSETICEAQCNMALVRSPDHPDPRNRVAACYSCQRLAEVVWAEIERRIPKFQDDRPGAMHEQIMDWLADA